MLIPSIQEETLKEIAYIIKDFMSGTGMKELLSSANIPDIDPNKSKRDRLYHALVSKQRNDKCANNIMRFIEKALNPSRYSDNDKYDKDRELVNYKLAFEGFEISNEGKIVKVTRARTVSEAQERSMKIKRKVGGLILHSDAVKFCEKEWLKDNYFHAILECTKSIFQKLRDKSGYHSDGSDLVNDCFALGRENKPMLAFNQLVTSSERSVHKGFANKLKGFNSMYRNPKAHDPKINEDTQVDELMDVLIEASIIHKKLDVTYKTGYK